MTEGEAKSFLDELDTLPGVVRIRGGRTMFYKCRACRNGMSGFISWCAEIPMIDADPIVEPAEPLWFNFGNTEEKSISNLQSRFQGVDEWIRQKA